MACGLGRSPFNRCGAGQAQPRTPTWHAFMPRRRGQAWLTMFPIEVEVAARGYIARDSYIGHGLEGVQSGL